MLKNLMEDSGNNSVSSRKKTLRGVSMQKESETLNRIKFQINGEDYYIKGSEPVNYIEQVASYVDQKVKAVLKMNPKLNSTRAAVLAALHITDELFKLQQEYEEFLTLVDNEPKG